MDVRFLHSGNLDLTNGKEKPVKAGYIYPVFKVVYSADKLEADIYFKDGTAKEVSANFFEIHGRTSNAEGEQFLFFKEEENDDEVG